MTRDEAMDISGQMADSRNRQRTELFTRLASLP